MKVGSWDSLWFLTRGGSYSPEKEVKPPRKAGRIEEKAPAAVKVLVPGAPGTAVLFSVT